MFLGFDTSNYTSSVAALNGDIVQQKQLLKVKEGEKGLRQSEAVFQHTVNIPALLDRLEINNLEAVGVSSKPRNAEGSYMPCFLVGEAAATAAAKAAGVPLFKTSHQVGHILAALYSSKRLELINETFIAFHLSGGTTEALLVKPDKDEIIKAEIIAESLDLKAGQAIDRAGVMLNMAFPCGKEMDELSKKSNAEFKIRPSMKGLDCSLSGVENKAQKMFEENADSADISRFVLSYISETVLLMTQRITEKYGAMPIVFSGGVSSNSMLREKISRSFEAYFAQPEFSLDNAAGCAVYAKLKLER